jgi:hypothetical protein
MVRRVLLGSVALIALVHGVAWACSCPPDEWTTDEVLAHDLVVWGEVQAIEVDRRGCGYSTMDPVKAQISVLEGFVGAEAGDTVVVTTHDDISCGVDFGEGERWLVVVNRDEIVSLCSASHEAPDDDPLLGELRDATAR